MLEKYLNDHEVIRDEFPGTVGMITATKEKVGGKIHGLRTGSGIGHHRVGCNHEANFQTCPALNESTVTCQAENFQDGKELGIHIGCWPAIQARMNNGNGHHSNFHQ